MLLCHAKVHQCVHQCGFFSGCELEIGEGNAVEHCEQIFVMAIECGVEKKSSIRKMLDELAGIFSLESDNSLLHPFLGFLDDGRNDGGSVDCDRLCSRCS